MGGAIFGYFREKGVTKADDAVIKRLTAHAEKLGFQMVSVLSDPQDVAVTAKGTNFSKVLVQMHAGEADHLAIEELTCLSDDLIEQEVIVAHLRRWGIQISCVSDPELSTSDPDRLLLRRLSSSDGLSRRLEGLRLAGRRAAARKETGKTAGAKRYGQRPGEQDVLDQIHEWQKKGIGNTEISRRLNDRKIPSRRGKQWLPTTVANILGARRDAAARKSKKQKGKPTS